MIESKVENILRIPQNQQVKMKSYTLETLVASLFVIVVGLNFIHCHYLKHEIHPSPHYQQQHHQHYPHFNPYSYGYDVEDHYGNKQWRQERSHNPQEVHGSYGYRDNNGIYREVVYVADKNGFRANIKTNEPGTGGSKSPAGVKLESYYPSAPSGSAHPSYQATLAAVPPSIHPVHSVYPASAASSPSSSKISGQHQHQSLPLSASASASASAIVHQVPVYVSQPIVQVHQSVSHV